MPSRTHKQESYGPLGRDVLSPMMKAPREFWLAGLGTLSLARRKGEQLLEKLVVEGEEFEKRSRERIEREADLVRARFADMNPAFGLPRALRKAFGQAETIVYHLVPEAEDWVVRREGEEGNLSVHGTKAAALNAARDLAHAREPSRIIVHRADGTIQTSHAYGDTH